MVRCTYCVGTRHPGDPGPVLIRQALRLKARNLILLPSCFLLGGLLAARMWEKRMWYDDHEIWLFYNATLNPGQGGCAGRCEALSPGVVCDFTETSIAPRSWLRLRPGIAGIMLRRRSATSDPDGVYPVLFKCPARNSEGITFHQATCRQEIRAALGRK